MLALVTVGAVTARRHVSGWLEVVATLGPVAAEFGLVLIHPKLRSWAKFLTVDQWRAIDAESERQRAPGEAGRFSLVVLVVLVVCAVSLTLQGPPPCSSPGCPPGYPWCR